jgi:hypothetical protein
MFRNWREFIGRMVKRSRPHTRCDFDKNREIADELAQADADYAAGNTVSGGYLRKRYCARRRDHVTDPLSKGQSKLSAPWSG